MVIELGLSAKSTETEDNGRKMRAVERSGDSNGSQQNDDTTRMMIIFAKLLLSNSQQIRCLRAILLNVYLISVENEFYSAIKTATTKWQEQADMLPKGRSPDRNALGQPHVHAWNGLLSKVEALLKASENLEHPPPITVAGCISGLLSDVEWNVRATSNDDSGKRSQMAQVRQGTSQDSEEVGCELLDGQPERPHLTESYCIHEESRQLTRGTPICSTTGRHGAGGAEMVGEPGSVNHRDMERRTEMTRNSRGIPVLLPGVGLHSAKYDTELIFDDSQTNYFGTALSNRYPRARSASARERHASFEELAHISVSCCRKRSCARVLLHCQAFEGLLRLPIDELVEWC
mmetsp:Transcript_10235/g.16676  ORF Transcript_10235/g.16676 Transcript_10235/m.16676 type:complete len:346 (+) Transcript_10235:70-1107(+)